MRRALQLRLERCVERLFSSVHSAASAFSVSCWVTEEDDGAGDLWK